MRKFAFVALASFTLGFAPMVFAQQGGAPAPGGGGRGGGLRAACAADMQKLCPNAQDRESRRQCLADSKAQLSPDCAAAVAAAPAAPPK
jgi:hypothetical protein